MTLSRTLGAARSDYAGNAGTTHTGCCNIESGADGNGGPPTGSDVSPTLNVVNYFRGKTYWKVSTGTVYGGSAIKIKDIPDGLTKTYLFGEKSLQPQHYDPNQLPAQFRNLGDDQSMYSGYDQDTIRWSGDSPTPSTTTDWLPLYDLNHFVATGIVDGGWGVGNFGSAHPTGCQFVMCDGSVQTISYLIDPKLHWALANRADGLQANIP